MKKNDKRQTRTLAITGAAGAAAVAITMFAAYRSTVNRLVPTGTTNSTPSQTFVFSAPAASTPSNEVPVQNNASGVPKPGNTQSSTKPSGSSNTTPANKPIIADVGNIMPVKGDISHPFSNGELVKSETLGVWKTHDGCDILCDVGTEVRSMSEGVVKEIKDDPLWGVYVVVEQNNGLDVQYCGLAKELEVKAGQAVKQGETLGKTGETNQCEILQQPHLHLAVKSNGNWIDPMSVVDSDE